MAIKYLNAEKLNSFDEIKTSLSQKTNAIKKIRVDYKLERQRLAPLIRQQFSSSKTND